MTAGIYRIRNRVTGVAYVGSTFNLSQRIKAHVSSLKAGRHENSRLRDAWAALGVAGFAFSILETVEADDDALIEAETRWTNVMRAAGIALYNVQGAHIGRRYGRCSPSLYRDQRVPDAPPVPAPTRRARWLRPARSISNSTPRSVRISRTSIRKG